MRERRNVYDAPAAELSMMLDAREARYYRQLQLLKEYGKPLISFSMNIAGPVKNTPLIARGFHHGVKELLAAIRADGGTVLFQEERLAVSGCEGMYVTDLPAQRLKKLTTRIEETSHLGRLFDLDVIDTDGTKLERTSPRTCLLCGNSAKECARSRAHSVSELQKATAELLSEGLNKTDPETIAARAVTALLYEACVTPKPGLVDRFDNGSHADMNIYTFMKSAAVLSPYFHHCVLIGMKTDTLPPIETLRLLREDGKQAERRMYAATGGVNTHKGAVFSMGLICAASGRLYPEERTDPLRIAEEAALMCEGIVAHELEHCDPAAHLTSGETAYRAFHSGGIRAEAEAGFPSVIQHGLPLLEHLLESGYTEDEAGAHVLLSLIAAADDTCMIKRGGKDLASLARKEAEALLEKSGKDTMDALKEMNEDFIQKNLSPGGSADLLSLTWFLHFMKED